MMGSKFFWATNENGSAIDELFRSFTFRFRRLILRGERLLGRTHVRSVYDIRLVANYDDATFKYCCVGAYGFFYSSLLEAAEHPFIFLDIGANQGLYSVIAAKNPHCDRVIAFEPVTHTAALCAQNFSLNEIDKKSVLHRKAISDESGQGQISTVAGHSGAATLERFEAAKATDSEPIEMIDHAGLDQLIEAENLPIFAKIDVEGHEEQVLRTLFKTQFSSQIVHIFYECDERWVAADKIAEFLVGQGFSLQQVGQKPHYDVLAIRRAGAVQSGDVTL